MTTMTTHRRAVLAGASAATFAAVAGCQPQAQDTKSKDAAMAKDTLGDLDATAIAAGIAQKDFTAKEAVEAAIERIGRLNPQLNFLTVDMFDAAKTRAGEPLTGPLAGVPTLIKDLLPIKGVKLMAGCRALKDNVATGQGPYADALYAAGLVPIGKSTTPEFGFTATTEPLLTGATKNPWDPTRSSGGSSGGAAAAVASGAVPIAHASDGGGSIRIPASACGLVGLKSSRGRLIANGRPEGGISISVDGCVSRTVRDTALWLSATEHTGANQALAPVGLVTGPNTRRLRIGVQRQAITDVPVHPEVLAALEAAVSVCKGLGHTISDIQYTIDGKAFTDAFTLNWASIAKIELDAILAMAPKGTPPEALFEPMSLGLKALFEAAPKEALPKAIRALNEAGALYAATFATVDVVLSPVLARPTVQLGEIAPTLPIETLTERLAGYVAFTTVQNAAGAPAISLPLGADSKGAPIGIMASGKIGDERTLLELAFELEQAAPWSGRKPSISA